MSDKDIRYLKSLETIDNIFPPAKGFCNPENINGTTADKTIIAQNNLIIELLIQIQKLLSHTISSTSVSTTTLENLQQSFQALQVSLPTASPSSGVPKPPPRKFVVKTDPQLLISKYKEKNQKYE